MKSCHITSSSLLLDILLLFVFFSGRSVGTKLTHSLRLRTPTQGTSSGPLASEIPFVRRLDVRRLFRHSASVSFCQV
jgi:hypothetical protein